MKIWISLFVVLCSTQIARAQVPAEYPDVPLKNQAYADIYFLYDRAPLDERRAMTRYEFAIAVARFCSFPSNPDDPIAQSKASYEAAIRSAFSGTNDQKVGVLARLFSKKVLKLRTSFSNERELV